MTKETDTRDLFERAASLSADFREGLENRKPRPTARAGVLDSMMAGDLPEFGMAPEAALEELAEIADPGLMATPGGKFFGWVIGGSHPAGVAADMLTSAWGQNAANYHCSPAAAMAEKAVSRWMLELLHLPLTSSVGLVSGATMANFTCLAAARGEVLCRVGWNVEEQGLNGAPKISVLIGADAHTTVFNALQYLGMGRKNVTVIETDEQGRMNAETLKQHLETTAGPKIVIAQAGQINTGAMDPFEEITKACRAAGAWLHVDGAFGLWANASDTLRPAIAGVEKADSWAVDGHKWLQLPYECGFAIVSRPEVHRRVMSTTASYLPEAREEEYEPNAFVPELSRRARGFAAWAVIKSMGRKAIVEMVEGHCALARSVARRLCDQKGVEVLNRVRLNQMIVEFTDVNGQNLTDEVISCIQERNRVFVGGANWRGRRVMRLSIISAATCPEDADLLASEIEAAWDIVRAQHDGAAKSAANLEKVS